MFHGNIYAKSNMFLFMNVSYFSSCIKIKEIYTRKFYHDHLSGGKVAHFSNGFLGSGIDVN